MFERIFSIIVAAGLIAMYILTLIFGLMQKPETTKFLMASVAATILVPVTIYAYQRIYSLIMGYRKKNEDNEKQGEKKTP